MVEWKTEKEGCQQIGESCPAPIWPACLSGQIAKTIQQNTNGFKPGFYIKIPRTTTGYSKDRHKKLQ